MSNDRKPIFLSYSRADSEFAASLYRDLEATGFTVWRDLADIRIGGTWWQQIKDVIKSADTLVLCLSTKCLRSEVVTDEWQYARQAGTRVVPVIAGDVDVGSAPRWTRRVDWVDLRPGAPERERAWARFIRELQTPFVPRRTPFMIGSLPEEYVPRSKELENLVSALVDPVDGAKPSIAALHGPGGYGKTTLARAVCQDARVRSAFDDGIVWVTLGERPGELLGRVMNVIEVLSGERPGFTTLDAATAKLSEELQDRYVLLVIDDVWNAAHLKPFMNGGHTCARLITTRNSDTLPAKIHRQKIDAMDVSEANALVGWGLPDNGSKETGMLAGRLGYWPLLLKLANGRLRVHVHEGRSLSESLAYVDEALTKRGLRFFDYANPADRDQAVAATLQVSLDLLTANERAAYAKLAVFPDDTGIPLSTLSVLWGLDALGTEELCRKLFSYSLLFHFDLTQVRSHDVLLAYLRFEFRSELAAWHSRFLDGFHMTRWHELSQSEPYLWDNLVHHLIQSGRKSDAKLLFSTQDWMRARLRRDNNRYDGFLADLMMCWDTLAIPEAVRQFESITDGTAFPECVRYALIASSINSVILNIPPAVAGRALSVGYWSVDYTLSLAATSSDDLQRAKLYLAALDAGDLPDRQRQSTLEKALRAVAAAENRGAATQLKIALLRHADDSTRERLAVKTLDEVIQLVDKKDRCEGLQALIPLLGPELLPAVMRALQEVAPNPEVPILVGGSESWVKAALAVADACEGEPKDRILAWALQAPMSEGEWIDTLAQVIPRAGIHLLPEVVSLVHSEVDKALPRDGEEAVRSAWQTAEAVLKRQLTTVPSPEKLAELTDNKIVLWTVDSPAPIGWRHEHRWARVLCRLASRFNADGTGRNYVADALAAALTCQFAGYRAEALGQTLPFLPEPARAWVEAHAVASAGRVFGAAGRSEALANLVPYLSGENKNHVLGSLIELIDPKHEAQTIDFWDAIWEGVAMDDGARSRLIVAIAPQLKADDWVSRAASAAAGLSDDYGERSDGLSALAPLADGAILGQILRSCGTIPDADWQAHALACLAGNVRVDSVDEIVGAALEKAASVSDIFVRAAAVAAVAPHLTDGLLGAALRVVAALPMAELQASVLREFAATAPVKGADAIRAEALRAATAVRNDQNRAYALAAVAEILVGAELSECMDTALAFEDLVYTGVVLVALAPQLPEPMLVRSLEALRAAGEAFWGLAVAGLRERVEREPPVARAVDLRLLTPTVVASAYEHARSCMNDDFSAHCLRVLAPYLEGPTRLEAVEKALRIDSRRKRAPVLSSLLSHCSRAEIRELLVNAKSEKQIVDVLDVLGSDADAGLVREAGQRVREIGDRLRRAGALTRLLRIGRTGSDDKRQIGLDLVEYLREGRHEPRWYVLQGFLDGDLYGGAMFSGDTVGRTARQVIEVCGAWVWWGGLRGDVSSS